MAHPYNKDCRILMGPPYLGKHLFRETHVFISLHVGGLGMHRGVWTLTWYFLYIAGPKGRTQDAVILMGSPPKGTPNVRKP